MSEPPASGPRGDATGGAAGAPSSGVEPGASAGSDDVELNSVALGDVEPARSRHAGRRSVVALTDDAAIVGRADGSVLAVERDDGSVRWQWPESDGRGAAEEDAAESRDAEELGAVVAATPFDGDVVVGSRGASGEIRCHDGDTGAVRWRHCAARDVGEPQRDTRFFLPFVAALESDGARSYAAARRYERVDGERAFQSVVYAFDPDGTVAWRYATDASPIALEVDDATASRDGVRRVAVAYNRCTGDFQHGLAVLDAADGSERWHWDPGTEDQRRVGDVSLLADGAAVASHGDYRGYRLGAGGAERWRVDLARPTRVGEETLYAYPNHVHATPDGAVFVTGNTYAEEGRETDGLHPSEHTAVGVDPDGQRQWTADVGGFASGVGAAGNRVAVPGAQHFRTRDADAHGLRVLDVERGVVADHAAEGIVAAAAVGPDGGVAAVEEPVAYHDGDETHGAYRLHWSC